LAKKKKLLIVDDHPMFREGLKSIIARNPELEVVGETGEGKAALEMAKSLKPDLVLMDISLPDMSGVDPDPDGQHARPNRLHHFRLPGRGNGVCGQGRTFRENPPGSGVGLPG
jgi:hypothetical protein